MVIISPQKFIAVKSLLGNWSQKFTSRKSARSLLQKNWLEILPPESWSGSRLEVYLQGVGQKFAPGGWFRKLTRSLLQKVGRGRSTKILLWEICLGSVTQKFIPGYSQKYYPGFLSPKKVYHPETYHSSAEIYPSLEIHCPGNYHSSTEIFFLPRTWKFIDL